jgi:competence protein ComGC
MDKEQKNENCKSSLNSNYRIKLILNTLIVITVIGIVIALVHPGIINRSSSIQHAGEATHQKLYCLKYTILAFSIDNNRLPETIVELQQYRKSKRIFEEINDNELTIDAWGNSISIKFIRTMGEVRTITIRSAGLNGIFNDKDDMVREESISKSDFNVKSKKGKIRRTKTSFER